MGDDLAPRATAPGLEPGSVLLEQDFDFGSLYALRAAVSAHAAEAGMGASRLYDVVTAAHELAANAVRHGAGRGHLRLWLLDGILHCEVSDAGRPESPAASADRPAGWRAGWRAQHGHGLWVVDRIADQFTIDRGTGITIATATFALGAD